jgi:hypothetical protein
MLKITSFQKHIRTIVNKQEHKNINKAQRQALFKERGNVTAVTLSLKLPRNRALTKRPLAEKLPNFHLLLYEIIMIRYFLDFL